MMKRPNYNSLENLSLFSYFAGLITMFLGVVVIVMDILQGYFDHIQVGIFIFAIGYALVKISQRITGILNDEARGDRGG